MSDRWDPSCSHLPQSAGEIIERWAGSGGLWSIWPMMENKLHFLHRHPRQGLARGSKWAITPVYNRTTGIWWEGRGGGRILETSPADHAVTYGFSVLESEHDHRLKLTILVTRHFIPCTLQCLQTWNNTLWPKWNFIDNAHEILVPYCSYSTLHCTNI